MLRKIIKIDEEKCNGCGLCVTACQEGAIGIENGKAKLLRDDYCDGLGNCLPVCPTGAITFEERDALDFNEAAVKANMEKLSPEKLPCGCAGSQSKVIKQEFCSEKSFQPFSPIENCLKQWPVQIRLVPENAPYFNGAHLLIAADCTAYAYGNFHNTYMKNKITLIGCPKLDDVDYSQKLTNILKGSDIKSVTVVRMEVPCCRGIENAVKTALQNCGKMIPWQIAVISTDGKCII